MLEAVNKKQRRHIGAQSSASAAECTQTNKNNTSNKTKLKSKQPFSKNKRREGDRHNLTSGAIQARRLSPKGKKERREGRMKDALALGGEEGRDKLRKAAERGKYPETRGCPNGATRHAKRAVPPGGTPTRGTETSHYPEEKKTKVIAQVAASERAGAQTGAVATQRRGRRTARPRHERRIAERPWKGRPQRVTAP